MATQTNQSTTQNQAEAKTLTAQKKRWWRNPLLWGLLGALLVTALYGRVAVFNLAGGLLGGGVDGYENMWDDFWVQKALSEFRNPFFTDYIYYPTGTSLRFHTLHPSTGIWSAPLWWLFGGIVSTNLVFLLSLAFTCFFAFLLIRDILREATSSVTSNEVTSNNEGDISLKLFGLNLAAFAGAVLFTFANGQVVGFFAAGQTEKLSAQWLPLYLFLMFRAVKVAGRWQLYLPLAALTLVILSLTDWQYTIYAVLTTILYFIFIICTRRTWQQKQLLFAKLLAIGLLYAAVVFVPLVLPMISEANNSPWLSVSEQSAFNSRDVLDFIRPDLTQPGYFALILISVGLVTGWRKSESLRFWAICGGVAAIMSLGPKLILAGTTTDVPLPYALLYKLPVLSAGRDPQRFYTLVMLAFGVLLAFGLLYLFDWLAKLSFLRLRQPLQKQALFGAATLVIMGVNMFGFIGATATAQILPPDWPPFYRQIAQDKEKYAILELPTFSADIVGQDIGMGYGTLHQKYRFGGRMARDHKLSNPRNFTKNALLFRDLFYMSVKTPEGALYRPATDFIASPDFTKIGLPLLNYYKVRYIVLYNLEIGRELRRQYTGLLAQVYAGTLPAPYYEDKLMQVYKVPEVPPLAPSEAVMLDVGKGWYAAENNGQTVWRWADSTDGQAAELNALNLSQQARRVNLSFKALTFVPEGIKQRRTIKVAINGYTAGEYQFPEYGQEKEIGLELSLPPGFNTLTFSSPETALPANPDRNVDARKLSFRLAAISYKTLG